MYLFALCNAFQGTAIFYYHILGNETAVQYNRELAEWVEMRTEWDCARSCCWLWKPSRGSGHSTVVVPAGSPNNSVNNSSSDRRIASGIQDPGCADVQVATSSSIPSAEMSIIDGNKVQSGATKSSVTSQQRKHKAQQSKYKSTTVRRRPDASRQFLARQTQYFVAHEGASGSISELVAPNSIAKSCSNAHEAAATVPGHALFDTLPIFDPCAPGSTLVSSTDTTETGMPLSSITATSEGMAANESTKVSIQGEESIGRSNSYVVSIGNTLTDNNEFSI